ncbi:ABC transporter permease [bacterium]|nr:ABC transporter permease [bacterium]
MLKNYLKVLLRSIVKNKAFSTINILGLAVGLTCTALILMWVQDELSYDTFHQNSERIFRVVENQYYGDGDAFTTQQTPAPLSAALKNDFPEIEQSTRVLFTYNKLLFDYQGKRLYESTGLYVDPDFLSMFSFPLQSGQADVALKEPNSILLTSEYAEKYFGNEDPIGKTIRVDDKHDLVVTGVFKPIPKQSHIQFDFIIPAERMRLDVPDEFTRWGNNWLRTYILIKPGVDYKSVNDKMAGVIKKHNEGSKTELFLQPMTEIYLRTDFNRTPPKINYVYTLGAIALLILMIACINFTNLSTARSIKRSREVGLRKVVGAARLQLIRQFLSESIFLAILSMVVALLLIEMLLPFFNDLTAKQLGLRLFESNTGLLLLVMVIFTGVVSGLYPAFVLSGYQPILVLKGTFQKSSQGVWLRKSLVAIQFTLSIALMICSGIIFKQLDYMQNKNLGYDKNYLVRIPMRGETAKTYDNFKHRLLQNSRVVNVTASNQPITSFGTNTWDVSWPGRKDDERVLTTVTAIDYDYIETMGMTMVQGRTFSKNFPTDSVNVIINEKAVEKMNLKDPLTAQLTFWDQTGAIVGVVKDFNYQSVHSEIIPLVFIYRPEWLRSAFVKIRSDEIAATVKEIEETWQSVNPSNPFEFSFVDEEIDALYRAEQRLSRIYSSFTILAVFISCLGLFGLASFSTEQRTKEIGVRKVLGASISGIVTMLATEFVKIVLLANLIAWPIAYFLMKRWLQDFAFRIDMEVVTFIMAGVGAIAIAVLTVSYQAIKAATANPVDSLKYE